MKTRRLAPATRIRLVRAILLRASPLAVMVCLTVTTCGGADGDSGTNNVLTLLQFALICCLETAVEVCLRFARERCSFFSYGLYEDICGIIHGRFVESAQIKDAQQKLLVEVK